MNKMTSGRGCPLCRGLQVLAGFNDLASRNPKAATEWHPTKNGTLLPEKVTYGSMRKVWGLGPCGHEREATITLRANAGTGCPFAAAYKLQLATTPLPLISRNWQRLGTSALTLSCTFRGEALDNDSGPGVTWRQRNFA